MLNEQNSAHFWNDGVDAMRDDKQSGALMA